MRMSDSELPTEAADKHNNYFKDYVSKHRVEAADPFEDALNVVIKAKEASELATKAQREADVISALADKAQTKAESITRIAMNLSGTAATVASAALRICGYDDYASAYETHPTYMDTLSLEELTKILSGSEDVVPPVLQQEATELRLRRSPDQFDLYAQQTQNPATNSQSSSASESSTLGTADAAPKSRTPRSPTRMRAMQRRGEYSARGPHPHEGHAAAG